MLAWTQIPEITRKTNVAMPSQALIRHADELIKANAIPALQKGSSPLSPQKNPSARELSAERPFLDIDLMLWFFSQIAIHSDQR